LTVPLPGRPGVATLRRHLAVNRAVVLARLEVLVLGSVVVQDLDLMASYRNPVVPAGLQLVLEAEDEVAILLDGEEVPTPLLLADEGAARGEVAGRRPLPACQRLAVENADEALVGLFLRQAGPRRRGWLAPEYRRSQQTDDHQGAHATHERFLLR